MQPPATTTPSHPKFPNHNDSTLINNNNNNNKTETPASNPPQQQKLSIIIHRGDPVDSPSNRHTAWFIEDLSTGQSQISHVTGGHGFFAFEEQMNPGPPSRHPLYEASVVVAMFAVDDGADEVARVREVIRDTKVNNADRGWNCQSFIGDGLGRLRELGRLSAGVVVEAADQMAEVVLAAPDED